MRKLFAAFAVAAVLGALPLVSLAQSATPSPSARLSTGLVAALRDATEGQRLNVLVHGTSKQAALDAIDAAGLELLVVLESIGVPAAVGTPDQIDELRAQPGVTYVEADGELELLLDTALHATRTDEAHAATFDTGCETTTTEGGPAHGHSQGNGRGRGNQAPTTTTTCDQVGPFTGAGQSIAIVDSGVDGTHPMFQRPDGTSKVVRNMKVACVEGVVWFNDNPATEEEDDRFPENLCTSAGDTDAFLVDVPTNDTDTISAGGHGTHVAGIAAGFPTETADGRIVSGTAPGADLVSISVGAGISILGADIALDWIARNHANPCATAGGTCNPITVVNNSYGPDGGGEFDPESATAKITKTLIEARVVVVWANGNGLQADTSAQPGGDGSTNRSNPEGQNPLPGVLSVANYDDGDTGTREGTLAPSSSRGHAERPETWPDVSAPGTNITSACRPYLAICTSLESDPNYGTIGGTSMAAPHVAGITTLLREANPDITPGGIEQALEDTAHRFQFGAPYWTEADAGNMDSPTSFDKGHGLVDTMAALGAVLGGATVPAPPPGQSACTVPLVTDDEGDATDVYGDPVPPGPQPSEPQLDIRTGDLAWDATASALTFTATVAGLEPTNPTASTGVTYELAFTHAGKSLYIRVSRDATGAVTATFGEFGTGTPITHVRGLQASMDPATDTITATLTNAQISAIASTPVKVFADGDQLLSVKVTARRNVSLPSTGAPLPVSGLVLPADDAAASCPFTIGTAIGEEPAPAPEPQPFPRDEDPGTDPGSTEPDATLADGESFESTVVTTNDTFGVPQVDDGYQCDGPDDPTCFTFRVEAVPGAAGSTLIVYLGPAVDQAVLEDWDIRIFDAAGQEIDAGWNGVPTHGGPQTVSEVWGAFVDVPTTAVYSIVLQPYYALEGSSMTVYADLVANE